MSSISPDVQAALQNLFRTDGWQNLFTSLGVQNKDSRVHSSYSSRTLLSDQECADLYAQNWQASRAVDAVAEDAVKAWYALQLDDDTDAADGTDLAAAIDKEHERLGTKAKLQDAITWARVFGGAAVLIGADDGEVDLTKPLRLESVKRVRYLHVLDRRYAIPSGQWDDNVDSPNFGMPALYSLQPLAGLGGSTRVVHWTRIMRFEGSPVPSERRQQRQSWGDSVFEKFYDPLRNLQTVLDATATACQSFSQGVLKVQDLASLVDTDQESKILARLRAFKMGLGMANLALIDASAETYERVGQPVAGLKDLIDAFQLEATGATRTPQSKTYGAQQGKLAGSTEDTKTWDGYIAGIQEKDVIPQLRRLTEVLLAQREGPLKGKPAPPWSLKANPLTPPDLDKEVARRKVTAETDKIYYEMNALEPSEMRNSRFGGPAYSHETTLDPAITTQLEENERAEREKPEEDPEAEPPVPPGPGGAPDDTGGTEPGQGEPEPKPARGKPASAGRARSRAPA